MKKTLLPLIFLVCLVCLPVACKNIENTQKIDAILIQNALIGEDRQIGRSDAALLITDKQEIAKHKQLFFNNQQFLHACGYSYDLQFWSDSELQKEVSYNTECGLEEFKKYTKEINVLMNKHQNTLRANPKHFIYALKIPVFADADALIQTAKKDGLSIFPLNGKDSRYPSLEIVSIYKGEGIEDDRKFKKEIIASTEQLIDTINKEIPILKRHTPAIYSTASYNRTYECEVKAKLQFALNTDLASVAKIIKKNGADSKKITVPEYYYLHLVDQEPDKEKIKQKIKKYPEIKEVL